ncbi:MAG: hypothetical protein J7647_13065 [Cyanobacteria bacterium SBLK]|nr:hypothetical protein [Cyanobacteria bacterium SBLK]
MEDYHAAFLERHKDTETLNSSKRKIATMHFGGCTIECLLKSMIFASLPRGANREWKTDSNNPGHTTTNPGHSFQNALRRHNRLNSRVQNLRHVMDWISLVESPSGHFINLRYSSNEPSDADYKKWLSAYRSLKSWLEKQATTL